MFRYFCIATMLLVGCDMRSTRSETVSNLDKHGSELWDVPLRVAFPPNKNSRAALFAKDEPTGRLAATWLVIARSGKGDVMAEVHVTSAVGTDDFAKLHLYWPQPDSKPTKMSYAENGLWLFDVASTDESGEIAWSEDVTASSLRIPGAFVENKWFVRITAAREWQKPARDQLEEIGRLDFYPPQFKEGRRRDDLRLAYRSVGQEESLVINGAGDKGSRPIYFPYVYDRIYNLESENYEFRTRMTLGFRDAGTFSLGTSGTARDAGRFIGFAGSIGEAGELIPRKGISLKMVTQAPEPQDPGFLPPEVNPLHYLVVGDLPMR